MFNLKLLALKIEHFFKLEQGEISIGSKEDEDYKRRIKNMQSGKKVENWLKDQINRPVDIDSQ